MGKFNVGDVVVTLKKCGWAKSNQGVMLADAIGKVKAVDGDLLTVKFNKKQPTPNAPKQARKNFVVRTSEVCLATAEEAASIAKKKAPVIPQVGDVVTFEGFDGEYRKVDRKAQAGDVVVFRNPDNDERWITLGKPYKAVTGDTSELEFEDNYGDQLFLYVGERRSTNNTDVYEKVEAEYVPQEGDIVVITANTNGSRNKVGDIGKVTEIREFSDGKCIRVHVNGRENFGNWTRPTEYRKATPAEVEAYEKAVADASKPKLKAGDFVKFEEPDLYDITVGKIYEVQTDDDGDLCIIDDVGDEDYSYLAEFAIKIDADDVKWAKIGRTKDEYKVGDIVEITEDCCGAKVGEIVKVSRVSDDRDGSTRIYYAHHEGALGFTAHYGTYKLIATVESTLN